MRLLVKLGYEALLFAPTATMQILQDIGSAQVVEEAGPYNQRVWQVKDSAEVEVKLIADDDIRLPEKHKDNPAIGKLLETVEANSKLQARIYNLEAQLKKYETAAGALVASTTPAKKTAGEDIPF